MSPSFSSDVLVQRLRIGIALGSRRVVNCAVADVISFHRRTYPKMIQMRCVNHILVPQNRIGPHNLRGNFRALYELVGTHRVNRGGPGQRKALGLTCTARGERHEKEPF
jgi:hypothetical protein